MKNLDAIMISTGRAASTGIYQYLNVSCRLNLPDNKEPHFWCDINKYSGTYDLLKQIYVADRHDYDNLYSSSKLSLDASVGYFFYIDEVIDTLRKNQQNPKVIFLYREPLSRALSLFNEQKRKGLTQSSNILNHLRQKRKASMWWEYYYDNVLYADAFDKMKQYFNEIYAINYEYFANNQEDVIKKLSRFLSLDAIDINLLNFTPVNSSAEAIFLYHVKRMGPLKKFGR